MKLVVELLRGQLTIVVKINIHIYLNMLAMKTINTLIETDNRKVIDSGYHSNRFKRKISEALYIKQYKPMLNTQEQSIPLKLFN